MAYKYNDPRVNPYLKPKPPETIDTFIEQLQERQDTLKGLEIIKDSLTCEEIDEYLNVKTRLVREIKNLEEQIAHLKHIKDRERVRENIINKAKQAIL